MDIFDMLSNETAPQPAGADISSIPKAQPDACGAIIERTRGAHTFFCNISGPVTIHDNYTHLIQWLRDASDDMHIILNIYSPGGDVCVGIGIAHAIANTKAKVTTVAFGLVASIAAVIWACGHVRLAAPCASALMFHMPSSVIGGKTADIAEECELVQKYFLYLLTTVTRGLLTPEEIETVVNRRADLYLSGDTVTARIRHLEDEKKVKVNNETV